MSESLWLARCPSCGAAFSWDVAVAHQGAREALIASLSLSGALGRALLMYLSLFRGMRREISMDRVARLLGEIVPDIQAGTIKRNGTTFQAPPQAWVWAIDQSLRARDEGRLKTPLKGHGWLYEVITQWKPDGVIAPNTAVKSSSKVMDGIDYLKQLAGDDHATG